MLCVVANKSHVTIHVAKLKPFTGSWKILSLSTSVNISKKRSWRHLHIFSITSSTCTFFLIWSSVSLHPLWTLHGCQNAWIINQNAVRIFMDHPPNAMPFLSESFTHSAKVWMRGKVIEVKKIYQNRCAKGIKHGCSDFINNALISPQLTLLRIHFYRRWHCFANDKIKTEPYQRQIGNQSIEIPTLLFQLRCGQFLHLFKNACREVCYKNYAHKMQDLKT